MEPRSDVVAILVATGKWREDTAQAAERANYCCEYCGRDLLESIESYKLFQKDHIVPVSRHGREEDANLAIACRHCNSDWKGQWDPRTASSEKADRSQLIKAAWKHIEEERDKTKKELEWVRQKVGWRGGTV